MSPQTILVLFSAILLGSVSGFRVDNSFKDNVKAENSVLIQCWSSTNTEAPRWWPINSIIERGTFLYRCEPDGRFAPHGCQRSEGNSGHLAIGESETVGEVQYTCTRGNAGFLEKQVTGCVDDGGRVYGDGETWDGAEGKEWFTCQRSSNGYFMRVELMGCTHEGERIKFGERRVSSKCWMECRHDFNGEATMSVCGCSNGNGKKHLIGDTFEADDGRYTEYCTKEAENSCSAMTVGCVHNYQRLNDGDRYFRDSVIYQCEVRQNSHKHKVTGCVQNDQYGNTIERLVNCRWYHNDGQHEYEVTCKQDPEENDTAYVHPEACIYMRNGRAALYILPDTYTLYWIPETEENLGVLCKRVSKTELRIEEFPANAVATRSYGLKYDAPRGKK